MDKTGWRLLALTASLTLGVASFSIASTPNQILKWLLFLASLMLLAVWAISGLKTKLSTAPDGPVLSRGLTTIEYKTRPYGQDNLPFACHIKFRTKKAIFPARFRVECDGRVQSATAVLDEYCDGEWIDGYSYFESTHIRSGQILLVEVSDRPITSRDEFYIEVRSDRPVHILKVDKIRSKGAHGIGFSAKPLEQVPSTPPRK